MLTDQLIGTLARHAGPAPRTTGWRAMGLPLAGATTLALAGGVAVLGAVPVSSFATPAPWMKLAYTGLLAWALGLAALHAGLPAHPWRGPLRTAGIVFLLMAALGFGVWSQAPAAQQAATVLGRDGSWVTCAPKVMLLALPVFAAAVAALRRLAPTRLLATGALAGAAAGACGALAYSFCCPESSAAYVAVWYTAGIAACAAAGALLGPRLLRW
jgi:hypothetical protein